ncbi:MAG: T9SS type A sorting domain-containing protein [Bacteroidia bacterium]|nr:T9SS type A sorting domain-containing protein [Bacteroidia bacterium]
MAQPATNWWNQSVFYELFVRSFYDSNGNGIGDFNGITAKLDYLNDGDSTTNNDLGIKGIWLMPMNASPSYHGYDVTNYKAVNNQYGTTAEFKNMVSEAHKRGIKVIIDFVINHTSSQHPWFVKSAANDPFYRDFYRWSATKPTYKGPWGQEVWYAKNSNYYYALFWSEMPDLNYNYQPVKDSIFDAAKYWIDSINIDGFRLDAAMYLYENGSNLMNQPETYQFWSDFNNYCKSLNPNFMTVGEVWTATSTVKSYNNKLDNCFEFDLASAMVNVMKTSNTQGLRNEISYACNNLQFNKFSTFLTNHDQNRVFDEFGGNISKLKTAASIYLTLPGTPYLYYGEEVGMKGSKPDELIRTPMQWSSGTYAGFSTVNPWINLNSNYSSYNVQLMQADTNSLFSYYKKLIKIRNNYQALSIGTYQNIICNDSAVFSFLRIHNNQTFLVMVNTASRNANNLYLSLNTLNWNNGVFTAKNILNNGANFLSISDNVGTGVNLLPFETKVILLDKSTGLEEVMAKTNFTISPNPYNDNITILLAGIHLKPSYEVQIFNAVGKLILTEKILSNETNSINLELLSKGIYFVKLDNGVVKKLVKE